MSDPVRDVRIAAIPADLPHVERLWLEYLTWGNDENEARHGFRLPVREAVAQFEPPRGRVLLAWQGDHAFGIGCLRGSGSDIGEIKRMYVEPSHRGTGAGSALLDGLIVAAREAGYARLRLDSPDFMTDAHRLYRRRLRTHRALPGERDPRGPQSLVGVHGAARCSGPSRPRERVLKDKASSPGGGPEGFPGPLG